MRKHIIALVLGLAVLAAGVWGLNKLDDKVAMPLLGNQAVTDPIIDDQPTEPDYAGEVQTQIAALANPITLNDAEAVKAARAAYDSLSAEDQAKVGNLTALEAAEASLKAMEQAKAVEELIAGSTMENAKDARAAFETLPEEARQYVGNLAVLEDLEKQWQSRPVVVGEIVRFTGGSVYSGAKSSKVAATRQASTCKVTYTANGAHPYHLVSTDGKGVYGWVDAANVVRE